MCNSAEQSGGDHASDSKNNNGFTSESDLLLMRATNGNGSVGDDMKHTSAQNASANTPEEAAIDIYKGAGEVEMRANMKHSDETQVNDSSVGGTIECQSRGPCIDLEQENLTLKNDVPRSVQEGNRVSTAPSKEHKQETNGNMGTCIAARSKVAQSKAPHNGQVALEETDQNAKEHVAKNLNEANQNSSIEIEQQDSHVPSSQNSTFEIEQQDCHVASTPQLAHASDTKGINGPELAEFFSNARGSKDVVEIEEQDHAPIRVRSPPKRKSYKESPRSLRMLLFSDETVPFAKKEEKHKRDGKSIDFSNKVVPASEGIGDEGQNEDINFPRWHESEDTLEASSPFSGPLVYSSGALTYQGMNSYTGPVAYSGSISHRSDSSTSTRSFAFPILASDWNTSPVKMGAPDPRLYRQQRKRYFCFCCRRPSTLVE